MTTKIYIAGNYYEMGNLAGVVEMVEDMGIHVTARWITGATDTQDVDYDHLDAAMLDKAKRACIMDCEDIDNADAIVVFTFVPSSTGGYHWEHGYAAGRNKKIFVCGPITNLFQTYPGTTHCEDIDALFQALHEFDSEVAVLEATAPEPAI